MTLDHLYATFKENVCVTCPLYSILVVYARGFLNFYDFFCRFTPRLVYPFLIFLSTICVYLIEDKKFLNFFAQRTCKRFLPVIYYSC